MPRLAANLTTMFTELAPIERFAAARQVGFDAVEYLQPYGHTIEELRMALTDNELELILVNTRMGNAEAGERGVAALPGRENDFKTIASESLEYASELGAGLIHVMAGVVPDDKTAREC
jgi:hydroxypyruvate isomerase